MNAIIHARRACCLGLAGLLLGVGAGCGAGVEAADPAQAREALGVALDAWKAGESPADLEKRAPAILVKDVDWEKGLRLVRYQADGEGKLFGFDLNYRVALELKAPKGRVIKRVAVYTVTTRPQLLVLRQEG